MLPTFLSIKNYITEKCRLSDFKTSFFHICLMRKTEMQQAEAKGVRIEEKFFDIILYRTSSLILTLSCCLAQFIRYPKMLK